MEDREKLIRQLFMGKVCEILGVDKTMELIREAKEAHNQPSVLGEVVISGSALSPFDFKKGNIFYDTKMKSLFTIKTFNDNGVRTIYPWGGSVFLDIAFVSPLKLTDDLLLKLGFDNEVIDSQESVLGFTKKYKGKYCDYFSDLDIQKNENYYFIDLFDFNFIYVHELQNFYHCLTGEMLSLS